MAGFYATQDEYNVIAAYVEHLHAVGYTIVKHDERPVEPEPTG